MFMVKIDWPAFCASFQPPPPAPLTRTRSPTAGFVGRVTVTRAALCATYPRLHTACWVVPVTSTHGMAAPFMA